MSYKNDFEWTKNASLTELIIGYLLSGKSFYRRRVLLLAVINKIRNTETTEFNQSISRLKRRGIIDVSDGDAIYLNKKGYIQYGTFRIIKKPLVKKKEILLIFDIPQEKRKIRDWLRRQIKEWDFIMIQHSVWRGWGPLPKEFNERLKMLGIEKCVKTFTISRK